jgi:pimeloyl-ACP methyl ester carboxylesterase
MYYQILNLIAMKRSAFALNIVTCIMLFGIACSNNQKNVTGFVRHEEYINVGTHKIRVIISDLPSDYTIILESGGGRFSDAYEVIQDTLARLTGLRVLSYDRSGFGKSELGPDTLTALDEVGVLKKCLDSLGFQNNYILVGHSYGGFLIQLFTKEYPVLVKGLVLIDPMNVNFVDRFGLDKLNSVTPYFQNPIQNWEKAGNRMVDNFPYALGKLRGYELPVNIPVFLITAGNPPFESDLWRKCHEEMVMNSAKHKLIIAKENGHDILTENPGLVLKTIVELVSTIKLN